MHAMILAAGKGTRLRPLTDTTPKPLLPIAGEPLIVHQVRALAAAGVSDIVVNLHHLGDQIRDCLAANDFGVSIHFSHEAELLETGGALRYALPLLPNAPFWLLTGDIFTDFDFTTLPKTIAEDTAHIVLTPTPSHREHGDFDFSHGKVTRRGEGYVYCGIACLHPSILQRGPDENAFSLRDIYFEMIQSGRLLGQIHAGNWHDIGTLSQYEALVQQYPN